MDLGLEVLVQLRGVETLGARPAHRYVLECRSMMRMTVLAKENVTELERMAIWMVWMMVEFWRRTAVELDVAQQ